MFFLPVLFDLVAQIINVAIHAHTHVAGAPHLVKDMFMRALSLLYQRRKQHDARTFWQIEDRIDNLLDSLLADLAPAFWTVRMADTSIQQTQVIINLGYRPDRLTRVLYRPFLIDTETAFDGRDCYRSHL